MIGSEKFWPAEIFNPETFKSPGEVCFDFCLFAFFLMSVRAPFLKKFYLIGLVGGGSRHYSSFNHSPGDSHMRPGWTHWAEGLQCFQKVQSSREHPRHTCFTFPIFLAKNS